MQSGKNFRRNRRVRYYISYRNNFKIEQNFKLGFSEPKNSDFNRERLFVPWSVFDRILKPHFENHVHAQFKWDEVADLEQQGLEVGSHGICHGFWDRMTDEELKHEIVGSSQILAQKLGHKPISISYPAGKYDERVIRLAKEAGYEFGVANLRSENNFQKDSMMEFPRIDIERDVSFNLFKGLLLLPSLFN